MDPQKFTIIFTATWNKTGYSAIDKWVYRLPEIINEYNVLVTVHHWATENKKQILENTEGIYFIKEKDILAFLKIADIMIADISSIIAEFNSLDKPIITFTVPLTGRFTSEIRSMLENIYYRVDNFDELKDALKEAIRDPNKHSGQRRYYNNIMFDKLDGKASDRACTIIKELWKK